MKYLAKRISAVASFVIVAGCGGWQPPSEAPGATTQSRSVTPHAGHGDLLYVSDASGAVYVFSYPDGKSVKSLIGLAGSPDDVCSDPAGHVYVTEYVNVIQEYARDKRLPIATLEPPGEPEQCSVDPISGNLAVGIYTYNSHPTGVAVFQHARGSAMLYTDPNFREMTACSYDNNGNLFAAGVSSNQEATGQADLALAELPKGASKFVDIKLQNIEIDTGNQQIEWYDGALTVGEGARYGAQYTIYQLTLSGKRAKITGETQLDLGSHYVNGDTAFFIEDGTIALTAEGNQYPDKSQVLLWPYPNGGGYTNDTKPFGTQYVDGVTVSLGHSR